MSDPVAPVAPVGPPQRVGGGSDAGFATVALPMLLWVTALIAVVTIDITGYLTAASRAQALADAAALAAVVPGIPGTSTLSPMAEAERVVAAGNGRLESCRCPPGRDRVEVQVSVTVPGLVIPTLGAGRVTADAHAVLAPPEELAPGPTRERAHWMRPAGW